MENGKRKAKLFFIKLCSEKTAREVILQKKTSFKMDQLKKLFGEKPEYELVVYTPYILIIKNCNGAEVTFLKNGRILIKNVLTQNEAEAIAKDVLHTALDNYPN